MLNVLSLAIRGACLVTAVATAGLWGRSYFVTDNVLWSVRPRPGALVDSRVVTTVPGALLFYERPIFA